jgi:hypothetical protein
MKIPSGSFTFDDDSGWIKWESPPQSQHGSVMLCWLPAELRGNKIATYEGVFVMASRLTHELTIIDFTLMLNSLCYMGFIL